jgi:hypothetical protein
MARPVHRWIFGSLVAALVLAGAWRCGHDKKKKDSGGSGGTTTPTDVPGAPSDWDGTGDWSGSALKVVDE